MSATNFKTENNTYRKLIGNGLAYFIPRFQRDYTWTEEHWENLWIDILESISQGEPEHYMGYLVLQSQDERNFAVIDGQQRLTTLALIVLAALKHLMRLIAENKQPEENKQRLEALRSTYIGYFDPVTLVSRTKLTLNRNNNNYFQTYIVPLRELPKQGFRASELALRAAFEWFDERIEKYVDSRNKENPQDEGAVLASLIDKMSDRLFFTVISVNDELNAYKVFETLNARAEPLSSTDLLKNYLFSVLHKANEHEHELDLLDERWGDIVTRLGSEDFPSFLRVHWMSRHAFVRQSELFKKIRAEIKDRKAVFGLLFEMEEDIDTYIALAKPEISDWQGNLKKYIKALRLFSVRQPFPLIIAARNRLNDTDFESLLRACVVISMRYNVIGGLSPNKQEHIYSSVAQKIAQGEIESAEKALEAMKAIYPSDEHFKAAFTEKTFRRNTLIARYILCALEKQVSQQDYEFESDLFNIEHILPKNRESGWEDFSNEEAEAMLYRIGNMCLLSAKDNKNMGNAEFLLKKPILAASTFLLTKEFVENAENWTMGSIEARQKSLAKTATAVWRIAQLS